jgi:uncharacterized protein (TIGR03084 family)
VSTIDTLRRDLAAEHDDLEALLRSMARTDWVQPTASEGWDVGDQVAHLEYFDRAAATAISDAPGFAELRSQLESSLRIDVHAVDDLTLRRAEQREPAVRLDGWLAGSAALRRAAATLTSGRRVPWYGPTMSAESFLTARLMETWVHGEDVAESIGVSRVPGGRLRHIAHLGFITRGWSYANRHRQPPTTPVRVELVAPDGTTWTFGEPDAVATVRGPAVDFCRVVTQRRHIDDTSLLAEHPVAREWMLVAQAFAGPATSGRRAHDPR